MFIDTDLLEKIVVKTVMDGGYSINMSTKKDSFDSGYFVSLDKTEVRVSIYKGTLLRGVIKEFLIANSDLLSAPDKVLGLWVDEGFIYVDVATLIESFVTARDVAITNEQLAIYDNYNKKTIYLNQI